MEIIRKITPIIMVLLLLGQVITPIQTQAKSRVKDYEAIEFDHGANPKIELLVNKADKSFNLKEESVILRMAIDARLLASKKTYPQNYKIEVYRVVDAHREFISYVTPLLVNEKQASNSSFKVPVGEISSAEDIFFDVYNSTGNLINVYKLHLEAVNINSKISPSALSNANCEEGKFNDCQIQYLFKNINFQAKPSPTPETTIFKELDGTYTVSIPLLKQRAKAGRKVGKKDRGDTIVLTENFEDGISVGPTDVEKALFEYSMERHSLDLWFDTDDNFSFTFDQGGMLGVGVENPTAFVDIRGGTREHPSLRLNVGDLTEHPLDGAIEYDGSNLYFTTNGTRQAILGAAGLQGPQGPIGPRGATGAQGPQGPQGPAGSISNNGSLQNLTVSNSFRFTNGANLNYILSSDANGYASWVSANTLNVNGDDLGNHTATQALDMNSNNITNAVSITATSFSGDGSSISNVNAVTLDGLDSVGFLQNGNNLSDLASASTARTNLGLTIGSDVQAYDSDLDTWASKSAPSGNVVGSSDVQTLTNKTLESVRLNGFTLFTNNSTAQFNGSISIPAGAGDGKVLSSDANGNASWVSASSLSTNGDDLGDHTATQDLDMSSNNITNAASITATSFSGDGSSITNVNATTVDGLDSSVFLQNGNNLSDITNPAAARSNLGLIIGSEVQAYDSDLDTWATKTAPTGTVVGNTDSQTLSNKTLQAANINGTTLFNNNSTAQFNGSILIPSGAGANKVLTSDGSGNATWQDATVADDLGDHAATQDLDMSSNNITNAASVTATSFSGDGSSISNVNAVTLDGLDSVDFLQNGNNLSDLASPASARSNLGLVIGSNVQAYDSDLTTWASKTAPSGTVIGSSDSQTLTNKTLQAANLNGTTLFNNNSTAQFNGTILIQSGAGTGKVLSSDTDGNATWTDLSTLNSNGDDLGNHTATQALDLATNDINNVGTITASFFDGDGSSLTSVDADTLDTLDSSDLLQVTNDLSDLASASSARTNLGVAIGTDVQAYDSDLDTWATKTAPSGTVVGTSDSQTLTNKTLQAANLNGSTLFKTNSTAKFNGSIMIPSSAGANKVLTSDGSGNATWQTVSAGNVSGALIDSNNLSDVSSASTARTNLGVAIGSDVQAYDSDLDAWATKTAPSGTVVGTSDSQTLTNKTLSSPTINSASLVTPTLNGSVAFANSNTVLQDAKTNGNLMITEQVTFDGLVSNSSSGGSATVNWTLGNRQKITLTEATTFSFTVPGGVAHLTLFLYQDGTGSRTASWPANVKWPSDTAPTLTTSPGDLDIVTCIYDGTTNYYCQAGIGFNP